MVTRASPYGFGMYAAYYHLYKDKSNSYLLKRSHLITEYFAFIVFMGIAFCLPVEFVVFYDWWLWTPMVNMVFMLAIGR